MKGHIDPEDLHGSFVAQLVCGNVDCKHQLAVSGEWFPERGWDEYPGDSGWEDQLLVKFILPALRMINPPEGTPKKVVDAIRAADSLLWINPSGSANQLRQAVEELLTCQKVKRTEIKNGKRMRISTHSRIKNYRAKNLDVADLLEAVKWIGNSGSHESALTVENVLDGAEYLSLALRRLYDNTDSRLAAKASKVNARKGVTRSR